MSSTARPAASRRTVVIEPRRGAISLNFRELWEARELLYFLGWREVRIRYKQTALGITWILIQPLVTMLIFSVIFGRLAHLPSENVPYPLFVLSGLIPWQMFAMSLTRISSSLVASASILTKVYFPRLLIPFSAGIAGLVDFVFSLLLLVVVLGYYGVRPGWQLLAMPAFVLLGLLTSIAVGLWLSALNVRYRDVHIALPFLVQIWFFVSPVAYSATLVPGGLWTLVYNLNPMAGVIAGFRWSLLGGPAPGIQVVGSTALVLAILIGGLIYFRTAEKSFADVV